MNRKRRSKSLTKSVEKRSVPTKRAESLSDETEFDTSNEVVPATDSFRLLNVPSHLLTKVFQKTPRKYRIASAQTCRDLYCFLVDTQLFYNTCMPYKWHRINLACHKDKIILSINTFDKTSPEYIIPVEECYRIRDYTFEVDPRDVALEMTHHSEDFIEAIAPILARCYCLRLGKMPNSVVGLSVSSMVKMLKFLHLEVMDEPTLLAKYMEQNSSISSIWFKRIPMSGDEVLDFFMNSRRSMQKIVMSGTSITGSKLIEFVKKSSFLTAPCLVTSDELRLNAHDLNVIKSKWDVDIDRNTKVCTFKPHNHNIVVNICLVTGIS